MRSLISPDLLRDRKLIVTHAGCPDGIASALVCKDAFAKLPRADGDELGIVFARLGTRALAELPTVPGMLFVDMTPPRERVAEFIDAGAVVLDHHKAQREIVELFVAEGLGVYADETLDPGISGATLAFWQVWDALRCAGAFERDVNDPGWEEKLVAHAKRVRHFAEVAGVRDTWQTSDARWKEACEQAAALRFWPTQHLLDVGLCERLDEELAIGPVLIEKDRERDTKSIRESFRFEVDGVRVLCFEGHWTSDIVDRLGAAVDYVIGWHYFTDGPTGASMKVSFSVRSRGVWTALGLAQRHGGGGHTQAAGFTLPCDDSSPSPHAWIRALVAAYVN